MVYRPHPKKAGVEISEKLKGNVDQDDIESEARALLTDPRDTITDITVWSDTEEQMVTLINARSLEKELLQ